MSGYLGDLFVPTPGEPAASYYYHQRQQMVAARQPTAVLSIDAIASVDNLAIVFFKMRQEAGKAPGPDAVTYDQVGRRELFDVLRQLNNVVLDGTYIPAPGRLHSIPKASGGYRNLTLRNIVDRVLAKALHEALVPHWETIFLDGSHGYRPGRSTWTMLAQLQHAMVEQDRWVLVTDDVKNAFGNVNIAQVMDAHDAGLSNPILGRTIDAVLHGGDPAKEIGIDQGCPYCPLALNVFMHFAHDRDAHTLGALPGILTPWQRYADNLVYACHDVLEGQQLLQQVNQVLGAAGLALKGENGGHPVDLRQGGEVQLLGFVLSCRGNQLILELGSEAWANLEQRLLEAHTAKSPGDAAQAAVQGWIAAYGPSFIGKTDRIVGRLLYLVSRLGFREGFSRECLQLICEEAYRRWRALVSRMRARQRHLTGSYL